MTEAGMSPKSQADLARIALVLEQAGEAALPAAMMRMMLLESAAAIRKAIAEARAEGGLKS